LRTCYYIVNAINLVNDVRRICDADGRVLHTLSDGGAVYGVTSVGSMLYVLRGDKLFRQIEVYDTRFNRIKRCAGITVSDLGYKVDMIACAHYCCAYLSDSSNKCIHRVGLLNGADITKWPVDDVPSCVSVTNTHSVLVTCDKVRKIKEFSTGGELLREIQLPEDVLTPRHTVQLSNSEFIVSHGRLDRGDPEHRVCLIDSDGHVLKSYGGPKGSGTQQMNSPSHLAVDRNGSVFVADFNNKRVLLLSPQLTFIREVLSELRWSPLRLWLDSDERRLYVGINKYRGGKVRGKHTAGQVVVVSI